ncbi:MAG: shikimate dehydrogenase, partial [Actinomycetia bacterium]|nr:shikimate dehydrogenase [Actinomycetes bacterium]
MSNGKYAFFIHPMDIEDVVKKYKIAKKVSPKVVASILKRRRPFVLSNIIGLKSLTGVSAGGSFIAVPLLPWQFNELDEDYLLKKIGKACKVAEKSGAKIVGLGAYTAIPGNGGEKLAKMVDVAVTTGNTYTVVIAIEGVLKAVDLMEIPVSDSTLAILGATGSIGSACLVYLAPFFKRTIALSRSPDKLKKLKNKVQKIHKINIETSTDISDLKDA